MQAAVSVKATVPKVTVAAPKASVSIKVDPKIAAGVKAGVKSVTDATKKATVNIKANTSKIGADIKATTAKIGAEVNKATVKIGAAVEGAAKNTQEAISKGIKATTDAVKAIKNKVRIALNQGMKFTNMGKPSDYMNGTPCAAKFLAAWGLNMKFLAMRNNAYDYGLKCVAALSQVRSSTICAACDNTNEKNFKTSSALNVSEDSLQLLSDSCAPFVEFLVGHSQVGPLVAIYAASVDATLEPLVAKFKTSADLLSGMGVDKCFATPAPVVKADTKKADVKPAADKKRRLQAPVKASVKVAVPKPAVKASVKVAVPKVKVTVPKVAVTVPKVAVTVPKVKVSVPKVAIKVTAKKAETPAMKITRGTKGWSLTDFPIKDEMNKSWDSFTKMKQTAKIDFGKLSKDCYKTAAITKMIDLFVFDSVSAIKDMNVKFWGNYQEVAKGTTVGADSAFSKYLGKNLFTLAPVAPAKASLKVTVPKVSLKVAAPKATVKVAAPKIAVPKVALKVAVPKVSLNAKASIKRRLQVVTGPKFAVTATGTKLNSALYTADVPVVTKLEAESDQVAPSKASLLAVGLLAFFMALFA